MDRSDFSVRNRRVVVVGAARSGVAAAEALARRGATVTLTDVEFADAEQVHVVGSRGIVLRSDDGGATFRVARRGGGS